jgi:hypothetical protein
MGDLYDPAALVRRQRINAMRSLWAAVRVSAAINPFGPSPKRTSTVWPGRSSVMP